MKLILVSFGYALCIILVVLFPNSSGSQDPSYFPDIPIYAAHDAIQSKAQCTFNPTEAETGTIVRVQAYDPPFTVCGLKYVGKYTIRNEYSDEKYLAFVTLNSKCFDKDGKLFKCAGQEEDQEGKPKLGLAKIGWLVDYGFDERRQNRIPKNEHGLLDDLRFKSQSIEISSNIRDFEYMNVDNVLNWN